jgi:hypothetical protein
MFIYLLWLAVWILFFYGEYPRQSTIIHNEIPHWLWPQFY